MYIKGIRRTFFARIVKHYTRHFSDRISSSFLLWDKLQHHGKKTAITDTYGNHSYADLFYRSTAISKKISDHHSRDGKPPCVVVACRNDSTYFTVLVACWMNGYSVVPLCLSHSSSQWEYFIKDSGCSLVISTDVGTGDDKLSQLSAALDIPHVDLKTRDIFDVRDGVELETAGGKLETSKKLSRNVNALVLYTSGTTGRPRGVAITHGILQSQVLTVRQAWGISESDVVLHVLPLHHTYGLVSALLCPLYCGGTVHMLPEFDSTTVWELLACPKDTPTRANILMAVPAIYEKLIEHHEAKYEKKTSVREFIRATCLHKMRLMVSGSTPLNERIFKHWENISGHELLEFYGLTEINLVFTNPLKGKRTPGYVGMSVPKVEVCIAKSNRYSRLGYDVVKTANGAATMLTTTLDSESEELYVRGPNVFQEYFSKPEDTQNAFTLDGWFKTGDTAKYDNGSYKILGRTAIDVIKSGGFKISALDVEHQLLLNKHVRKCVVVGLPDLVWGQKVAAVVVLKDREALSTEELLAWCKNRLPPYCVPTLIKVVDEIPQDVMGRTDKEGLVKNVFTLAH